MEACRAVNFFNSMFIALLHCQILVANEKTENSNKLSTVLLGVDHFNCGDTQNGAVSADFEQIGSIIFNCKNGIKDGPFKVSSGDSIIDEGGFIDDKLHGTRTLTKVGSYQRLIWNYERGSISGTVYREYLTQSPSLGWETQFENNLSYIKNKPIGPDELEANFVPIAKAKSLFKEKSRIVFDKNCKSRFKSYTSLFHQIKSKLSCTGLNKSRKTDNIFIQEKVYYVQFDCKDEMIDGAVTIDYLMDDKKLWGQRKAIVELEKSNLNGRFIVFDDENIAAIGFYANGKINGLSVNYGTEYRGGVASNFVEDKCKSQIVFLSEADEYLHRTGKYPDKVQYGAVLGYTAAGGIGPVRNGPDLSLFRFTCTNYCDGPGFTVGLFNYERREFHLSLSMIKIYMIPTWLELGTHFRQGKMSGVHMDLGLGYFIMPIIEMGYEIENRRFNIRGGITLKIPAILF